MAEQGCSNLPDANSRSKNPTGTTKISRAALWSPICGIPGLIILFYSILGYGYVQQIIGYCMILLMILGIVLGIIGLVQIRKSHGRLQGLGFAKTGLVLNIILSLAGVIPINTGPPDLSHSRERIAKIQISEFEFAIQPYAKDNGSFPTTERGLDALFHNLENSNSWQGPYLGKAVPVDPWGRPYHYRNPGVHNPGSYDLWSNGKDGIEGTADDIINWK
jgi:general secretion pathway protein G